MTSPRNRAVRPALWLRHGAPALCCLLVAAACMSGCKSKKKELSAIKESSVADLHVIHEGVTLQDAQVTRTRRVGQDEALETQAQGRCQLLLDTGARVLVDGSTKLTVKSDGFSVDKGRVFVVGAAGTHTVVGAGQATIVVADGQAGINFAQGGEISAYAAAGELTVRVNGADTTVATGEKAVIAGTNVTRAPELVFDDWTGGLAAPWTSESQLSQAAVAGTLWGQRTRRVGEAGSPLTLRSQSVEARVQGESADTRVNFVFFHGGSDPVEGVFRMGLPKEALVSGFGFGATRDLAQANLTMAVTSGVVSRATPTLEWAGDDWVQVSTGVINPGKEVHIAISYSQWLGNQHDDDKTVVQYRLPLVAGTHMSRIGEFSVDLDVSLAAPSWLRASHGATLQDNRVRMRRSDFVPASDFVVEIGTAPWKQAARMYVVQSDDQDRAGSYVLVRAEVPADAISQTSEAAIAQKGARNEAGADESAQLVVVLDASSSMNADAFDTARAIVEALVGALDTKDRALVLTASQHVKPLVTAGLEPMNAERKKAVLQALRDVQPGGTTDLGLALQTAADHLDEASVGGLVLYVGDGWASVGDLSAKSIRARLSRRAGGLPRLAAISVGSNANQLGLVELTWGLGPMLHAQSRTEGAQLANRILATAIEPTISDARLDLGPHVEQVYPLRGTAAAPGSTVFAVGRLAADLPEPTKVTLRWLNARGPQEKTLDIQRSRPTDGSDVRRLWGQARIQELLVDRREQEAIVNVALREKLLTPWTAWTIDHNTYIPTPILERFLNASASDQALYAARFMSPATAAGTMADFAPQETRETEEAGVRFRGEAGLTSAIIFASRRLVDNTIGSLRACRDARVAVRADLPGVFQIQWKIDGNGTASDIRITSGEGQPDQSLLSCLTSVVAGIRFPRTGQLNPTAIDHRIVLPPVKPTMPVKCSSASKLSLEARRGTWTERLDRAAPDTVFLDAKNTCELPSWTAKQALLELILQRQFRGEQLVDLANALDAAAEPEAAKYLRTQAVRRARTPDELRSLRRALIASEAYPVDVFEKRFVTAATDRKKLDVVQRFLQLAPHDTRLNSVLLALLGRLNEKERLQNAALGLRRDPLTDAMTLAAAASALQDIGDEANAQLALQEIVERAPQDLWARVFVGDRMRHHGWFAQAVEMYESAVDRLPQDQSVGIRYALAFAGTGRIDLAQRVLTDVQRTKGTSEDESLCDLADDLTIITLDQARKRASEPQAAVLLDQLRSLAKRAVGTVFVVQGPAGDSPIKTLLFSSAGANHHAADHNAEHARLAVEPQLQSNSLNMTRLVSTATGLTAELRLVAKPNISATKPLPVQVHAIEFAAPVDVPKVASTTVQLQQDGKELSVRWTPEGFVPQVKD